MFLAFRYRPAGTSGVRTEIEERVVLISGKRGRLNRKADRLILSNFGVRVLCWLMIRTFTDKHVWNATRRQVVLVWDAGLSVSRATAKDGKRTSLVL